ncbi:MULTISPECIES: DivIVA domain-containing protein [Micrococcaceae]|jgi:DivIVA domain-containing protein|uniref:DivIVA domain-containing protein n=1 Tax=Micrococcaceae TaxID=1268 RepID=UPI0006F8A4C8|nr:MULTISPECIES: DivIVA domain-containing protein [unclassified Arthrobacter]KRE74858.1 cell division protein [Arthrobacter sp. Soil761]TWD55935.1 DivIVA domain-containing protein [Arthrobacter sp. AG367]
MALTPEDVVNKRFQPTKFREGYDQDEVDDFLDEIVVELRRLNQENDELRKKLAEAGSSVPASSAAAPVVEKVPAPVKADKDEAREKAEAEAKAAEAKKKDIQPAAPAAAAPAAPAGVATPSAESAAGLLAMAQQMHDRHVADGQAQKDKIIAEAQIEASSLVNDAQEKSRKILGALEQQRSVLERKVEQLRGFERDYRSRLKAYIEGQLRDLDARGSVATPEVSEAN